jgi:hypothetical protein
MLSTLNDNTYSLSLAFDARKAVKALMAFKRDGLKKDDRLKSAVEDVIASLNALNSGTPLFAHLSSASCFQSYEQIQTLQEVQTALSDDRLTEKLQNLIAEPPGELLNESVDSAIQFFTAVENRALQKYNQAFGFGI